VVLPVVLSLVGGLLGVYQSSAKGGGNIDLVSSATQLVVRYPVMAMDGVADWTSSFGSGVVGANALSKRAQMLEEALAQYKADRGSIESLRKDLEEARAIAKLPAYPTFKKVPCDIVGYFPQTHRIILNVGSKRMIRPGAPVIGAGGLIGQVVEVSSNSSYVNLVTHSDFSVGARVVRAQSQEAGIATGQASSTMLLGVYTEGVAVRPGDLITTSGISTVYPEGIAIGHAGKVWPNKNYGIQEASIQPIVNTATIRHAVVLVR
jgi:rod shape-determining protein MreC